MVSRPLSKATVYSPGLAVGRSTYAWNVFAADGVIGSAWFQTWKLLRVPACRGVPETTPKTTPVSVAKARGVSWLPITTGVGRAGDAIDTIALASTCGLFAQFEYGPK